MYKRVLFHGPAAAGKSTLISTLTAAIQHGEPPELRNGLAVDLEDIGHGLPVAEREAVRAARAMELAAMPLNGHLFVGPAEIWVPKHFAWGVWTLVSLLPRDEGAYLRRVEERNRKRPEKAGQRELAVYRDMQKWYQQHADQFQENNPDRANFRIDPLEYQSPIEMMNDILQRFGIISAR